METGRFSPGEVHVGQDVGGRGFTVERDAVERYRAGTASGVPTGAWAPALAFHSECYRDLSWYLPNLIGNLHTKQEWELFQPFRVGETIRTRATIVERYRKRNRDYVVNEVVLTDLDGRWLQRSRTHQSFLAEEAGSGYVVDKEREKRRDPRFGVGDASGEPLDALEKTITLAMCQAFSGPHRSYHTDREMAQAMGFPDVVVQGMLSVCFLSELMTRNFGAGWFCGGELSARPRDGGGRNRCVCLRTQIGVERAGVGGWCVH